MKAITNTDRIPEEWRAGVRTRRRVAACDGATALCIFEQWIDPGAGAPVHFHPVEEVLTVLAGEAEFWLDGHTAMIAEGSSLIVPAWTKHGFRNVGASMLHLQAVLASSIFEATFEGSAAPVQRWGNHPGARSQSGS